MLCGLRVTQGWAWMAVSVFSVNVYLGVLLGKVSFWLGVTDLCLDVCVSVMAGCLAWS